MFGGLQLVQVWFKVLEIGAMYIYIYTAQYNFISKLLGIALLLCALLPPAHPCSSIAVPAVTGVWLCLQGANQGLSSECFHFYLSRHSPEDKLPTACEAPKPISNHNIQDQYGGCDYPSSRPATTFGLALEHSCWTDLLLDRSLAGQAMLASGLESLFEEREARLLTCWGQVMHFVAWHSTSSSTCFSATSTSSRRSILQPLIGVTRA